MLIAYECEHCGHSLNKYYKKSKDVLDEIDCEKCDKTMDRQLGAPNTKSTQFIDNGLQARRVEVMSEVVEQEKGKLYKDD